MERQSIPAASNEAIKPCSHSCEYCQSPLQVSTPVRRQRIQIAFPQSIREAYNASLKGCATFSELVAQHRRSSIWRILWNHICGSCECCGGIIERFRHSARILRGRPFALILLACPEAWKTRTTLLSRALLSVGDVIEGNRFNAYTYAGDDAASILPAIDSEVYTPQVIQSVKQWLSTCSCDPQSSTATVFRPTRLIDLGDGTDLDHFTVKSSSEILVPAYLCFSYCWGGDNNLICARNCFDTLGQWKALVKDAPTTIQHALIVTRDLGFRYIWVDSLCIAQDDVAEVEREIKQMSLIYKGARVTICASSAKSSQAGFLHSRLESSEQKFRLKTSCGGYGTIFLDRYLWSRPPIAEPLSTRAWAFQERYLSPRVLEYGWKTARWSCLCQQGYSGNQHLSIPYSDPKGPTRSLEYNMHSYLNPHGVRTLCQSREDLFQSWVFIVKEYSSLKMTHPEDRLRAISGVAQELYRVTKVSYLAGLWDHERLPSLLQWRVECSPTELLPRPKLDRAPSWSWAAIDNAVSIRSSKDVVMPFKIIQVQIHNEFGVVAHGSIKLQGPIRSGAWWPDAAVVAVGNDFSGVEKIKNPGEALIVWPDCADEIATVAEKCIRPMSIDLTFLAVGKANWNEKDIRGLLLKRKETGKDFIRMGMFQAPASFVKDWDIGTVVIT